MAGGGQHLGTEDSLDYEKAMQSLEDREFDIAQQQSKITRKKIGALSVEVADLRLEVREVRDKLIGVANDTKLSRDSSSLSTAVDINELRSELHNLKMAVTEICCFTLNSWPQCLPPSKAQHIQNGVAGTAHRLSHHAGEADGHADAFVEVPVKLEEMSDSDLTNILTQMRAQFDSVSKGTNGDTVLSSTYGDTKRDRELLEMRERFEAQIANISAGISGTEQKCLATTRASCYACKEELQSKIYAVDEAWRAEICSLAAEVRHLANLTSSLPQEMPATTCEHSGLDRAALQRLDSHGQALASVEDRLRQVDTDLRTELAGVTMDEKCLQQEVSNLKVLLLEEQDIHRSQMQQFEELLSHCRADVDKVLWMQDKSYQSVEAATKRSCEVPVQPRASAVPAPVNKAGSQTAAAPRTLSATLVPQQATSPAGQPPNQGQGAASPMTAWPSLPKVPVLTAVRHPPSNRQPVRRQGSAPQSVWQGVSRNASSCELSNQPVQHMTQAQALCQAQVRTGNMFDHTRDHSQSRSPPPREQRRHHSAEPLGSRLDSSPLPNPLRRHLPGDSQAPRLKAPMRQQFPQVTHWLPQPSAAVTAAVGSAPPVAGVAGNRASAGDLHSRLPQQQLATPRHPAAPASSCGGLASSTTSGIGSSTSGMASTATRLPAQFSETPLVVRHSQASTNPSPVDSTGSRTGSASSKALMPASAAGGGVPSLIGGEGTSHSDTCGPVIAPATASAAISMSVGQRSQPLVREANMLTAALEVAPSASCNSHAQAGPSDSTERGSPETPQMLTSRPEQALVLEQGGSAVASLTHDESVAGDMPSSPALSTPAHGAIKDLFDLPGSARSVSPRIMLSTGSAVTRHTLGDPHSGDIHTSRVAVSEELLKQMSHFLSPRETPRQVLAAHTAPAPTPEGPGAQGGR